MVKTRRSNGENGEVEEGNYAPHDASSVSDEKASNWSQRELRSSQYKVTRKIQHWPAKYSRRRRTIKMNRIVFPESDTEPEKYSRRSQKVRVFFAGEPESTNRSMSIRRSRGPRKNYLEESEDKPIQQNVRRSGRQRKLLHHNFNESWITNELKVRGYPGLYGVPGFSSSDEFTSGDERRINRKGLPEARTRPPPITDEDTQSARQRRTSARFNNSTKKLNVATETDSENENNETVIEKKPAAAKDKQEKHKADDEEEQMDAEETIVAETKEEADDTQQPEQDSESNQGPARSTRGRNRRARPKKEDFRQHDTASESESSESDSEALAGGPPRRSKRQRKQPAFVEIAPRPTRNRAKTFTIRKKPYSLRERKPKMLRRKTIRSQSPSSSSSSSTTSDTEEDLNVSMKNKTKGRQKSKSTDDKKTDRALREIQPVQVDGSVRFTSVGGLEDHIKCLREMVLFPLMYPDLFHKFKTRPAKGVLFHGPPGTGKTLLARALANECCIVGGRKVAFFMRKGADCLKKWVGESERHLKLLFQQANKMKPSIIFFDEIDALAPVRSVRQEQVHTSVVGTLLAEMDGLCDRGEVIIIGATNRLDAVDPALRRAGRFDRELYFPPPHTTARRDILDIYTKHWEPAPSDSTLEAIANLTNGYGGSDLKALCSEAVLKALRRTYPQVYESEQALLIDAKNVEVTKRDMLEAMQSLVAAGARAAPPPASALPAPCAALLQPQLDACSALLKTNFAIAKAGDTPLSNSTLLITGECADSHLAPALLATLEHCTVKELSVATVHSALSFTPEQAVISVFSECRRTDNCVLYIRDLARVCSGLAGGASLLAQLWRAAAPQVPLLATDAREWAELPSELQELFPLHKDCIYNVREPTAPEVMGFLKPIITEWPLDPPVRENKEPPPPLPLAPPPPPPRESAEEIARRKRKEDYKLRELRIFLRDICRKLASNRRFYKFTKPVDLEEVTDYLDIVKQPMDLETMMTKVDMHKYNCAREFLDDVDLICANALEYNPDRTSSDKQIRHEACSLRDHAHALIDVEMDSDFELECQDIARKRQDEGMKSDTDVPDFIYTASNLPESFRSMNESKEPDTPMNGEKSEGSAKRKRRRINAWSRGYVAKRQRTSKSFTSKDTSMPITDEESKENKPITSTPLPNGSGASASSCSASDEDAPLRRAAPVLTPARDEHTDKAASPTKSSAAERPTAKTSPKKRNSGQETTSGGDTEKVLINKTELDNLLYKNVKSLRSIGIKALLDLHSQLSIVLNKYAQTYDRTKLPQEYQAIIARYVQQLTKK
ncbi:ATPase family AAA domain-containing protein 2 [Plutella xylostella]|uniref:ATPase family AAA domain-containing protein 2 n=1 Tax=Plutella xylostella TaxID=51655 RepID=UPI0020328787|nr:ATPase family AAA domain-containing protein 2 [Plutella xylostella]